MNVTLRIILIVMSVATSFWILHQIRKAHLRIEDSVFWFFFSALLVIMGVFPQIMDYGAALAGVLSPVNFVFLVIIFVLIARMFRMSIHISQLESMVQSLVQRYALDHMDGANDNGTASEDTSKSGAMKGKRSE